MCVTVQSVYRGTDSKVLISVPSLDTTNFKTERFAVEIFRRIIVVLGWGTLPAFAQNLNFCCFNVQGDGSLPAFAVGVGRRIRPVVIVVEFYRSRLVVSVEFFFITS